MVDFSKLLGKKALEAPAPALMPEGEYEGAITKYELTQNRMKPPRPVLRLHLKAFSWPDTVEENDRVAGDITKKRFERDYTLENAEGEETFYYVDQLLRSCKLGGNGESYDEVLPQLNGAQVRFTLKRNSYQKSGTNEMVEVVNVTTVTGVD